MRALVLRDFWDLSVEELPDPVPEPGDVLIRVTATGICGSDLHGFTGETNRRHPGQVMGHETVGRVQSGPPPAPGGAPSGAAAGAAPAGGAVPGAAVAVNPVLACGQCAACAAGREHACPHKRLIGVHPEITSAFAELMAVPAGNLVPIPDTLPEEYGALVEPLAVGYHAALRGECQPDDRVLVIGAGPIGQSCIAAAHRIGAMAVAASEPEPDRRALAGRLGAVPLDPGAGELPRLVAEALAGPATLVLDAVGSDQSIGDSLGCSAPGARIVLVGMAAPQVGVPAYAVSTEERSLIGSFCYSAAEFRGTAAWVSGQPPALAHLIESRVDLDGAPAAFTRLARGASTAAKVLVFPNGLPGETR